MLAWNLKAISSLFEIICAMDTMWNNLASGSNATYTESLWKFSVLSIAYQKEFPMSLAAVVSEKANLI